MTSSVLAENLENRQCSFTRWGLLETHSSNPAHVCNVMALVWSKWKAGGSGTVGPALNLSVHFITPLFSSVAIDSSRSTSMFMVLKKEKKKVGRLSLAVKSEWHCVLFIYTAFIGQLSDSSKNIWSLKEKVQAEIGGTAVREDAPLKEDEKIVKMHKINIVQAIGLFFNGLKHCALFVF